jgi:hypothetical protein
VRQLLFVGKQQGQKALSVFAVPSDPVLQPRMSASALEEGAQEALHVANEDDLT